MDTRDPKVMGASLLRRISRKSGLSPAELAHRACMPVNVLMEAMNGERMLPARDCIRLSMLSGVLPADVAFEGR